MELIEVLKRVVHEVEAQANGWKIHASINVQNGKIENFDGYASKEGVDNVTFGGWRNGEKLTRNVHNITDEAGDIYSILEAFFEAVISQYEN